MNGEVGYPDSVARSGGAHPGESANSSAEARKEWAGPGNSGNASDNKPIGPQSGFSPLQSSQKEHGNLNDETDYRAERGGGY